jgi:hypothetical protein
MITKNDEMLALSERPLQLANDEGTAQIHDVALEIRRLATAAHPAREQLLEALRPFANIGLDILKNRSGWCQPCILGQLVRISSHLHGF